MKSLFSNIIFLLLLIPICLFAQTDDIKDYLVLNSGDTLYGKVEHVNLSRVTPKYYKKIRLTNSNGRKKKYKRKEVTTFKVNNFIYESFWLHQSSQKIQFINPKYNIDSENGEHHFLKAVSKGKISHYELEWWDQGESSLKSFDLLKKDKDQFFIRATQGLLGLKKSVLINYFSNCVDLQHEIKQKTLKKVRQVVEFYNNNCAH